MLLRLDPNASEPLFQQIQHQIAALIDGGDLSAGQLLPPSRTLARQLGVNRSTVVRAYGELVAAGYADSRIGAHVQIRQRAAFVQPGNRQPLPSLIDWPPFTPPGREPMVASNGQPVVDFRPLAPDPQLAPVAEWRRCMAEALSQCGGDLLGYSDAQGDLRLRQWLAAYLRRHRIAVEGEQILLTQGAQQGLDLIIRWLVKPGELVVVEAPTYSHLLPLLAQAGARVAAITMTDEGMDLDALARLLQHERPAFIYTIPTLHNPTGITTTQCHRERLMALAAQYRVVVVEDGFVEEMKYAGPAVPPLKALDSLQQVIYVGTFSKVIGPGLRLGYIAAHPQAIAGLTALNGVTTLGGSPLVQAACYRFCRSGQFETYLQRLHRHYRRRLQTLADALDEQQLAGVSYHKPGGGYLLWLTLAGCQSSEAQLVAALAEQGVGVRGGASYFVDTPPQMALRLSIAQVNDEQIRNGVARIAQVLRPLLTARKEVC